MKTALTALAIAVMSAATSAAAEPSCPLNIVPGRSLGPLKLGEPLPGPPRGPADSDFREIGPVRARYCGGRAVDLWLEDLRTGPDCVTLNGQPLARDIALETLKTRLGDCRDLPPRIGGAFVECAAGGLRLGYGLGTFLQVRVGIPGSDFDAECADYTDDGRPAPLPVPERDELLQRVLDLDLLAPFWHPDRPGRRPLPVLLSGPLAGIAPPALTIFGEPVLWLSPEDPAARKLPVFEFTRLDSTARRVRIEVRYAPEGVVGHVVFQRRGDRWLVAEKHVAER